jgi:hypothetical protein
MSEFDTLGKLDSLSKQDSYHPFGEYQEEAIISLALDHPEFFLTAARFIKPEYFGRLECRWIVAEILNSFEKFNIIPSRQLLRSNLEKQVTEDDKYEEIFRIVDRKSDPREVPIVKETLLKWSKDRAYGLLYADEAIEAYHRGDFSYLEQIVQEANRIADVGTSGFWFFENMDMLFQPDIIKHKTTGFARLDQMLNNGGPSAKEVVCWLAATNVGKCLSDKTLIIEENLSRIYELKFETGKIIKLRGSREVQTTRGLIKVVDLTVDDELVEIPSNDDAWDLELH